MINKERRMDEAIFKSVYADRVYADVNRLHLFLRNNNNNINIENVLLVHDPAFLILLHRFGLRYLIGRRDNKLELIDNSLYFKFSDYVMYNDEKDWKMSEEEKNKTKKIIFYFMKHGLIKKRILDIEEDKKAVFYAVDFAKFNNYLKAMTNVPNKEGFKKRISDGSIT